MKKILFIPDCHIPYHNSAVFAAAAKSWKEFQPNITVILGDFFDFYSVSSHLRDPRRKRLLEQELAGTEACMRAVEDAGASEIIYMQGNHEWRLDRYLHEHAPELVGAVTVDKMLGLSKRGWRTMPYMEHHKIGKVYVTHDAGYSGKSCVRQTLDAYQANVVFGHAHRIGYEVSTSMRGESHVAMCPGWLGDPKKIDYMPRVRMRDWAYGFGIGYQEKNGNTSLKPCPYIDGKFYL